jgi:hypothetical protein
MSLVETPAARLRRHIAEGTLIRHKWTGTDARGRETACLLAALAPACATAKRATACPADVMQPWLAYLTPWIDDAGTATAWHGHVLRFAALAERWPSWSEAEWEHKHQRVLAACVREAVRHTANAQVLAVCEDIASTLEAGLWPTPEQRAAAAAAAAAEAAVVAVVAVVAAVMTAEAADRLIAEILDVLEAEA